MGVLGHIVDSGYIHLYRKSLDSHVFRDAHLWRLWSWCLLKATYKERLVSIRSGKGNIIVPVVPGQFIFGRDSAAKELNENPSTIWKRMQKLKNIGNCDIESNSQYSVVTIINWDIYQSEINNSNSESNSQVTAKGQPSNTNNKGNKVKKVFMAPTLDEVTSYCRERRNGVNPEKWHAHYVANGWKVGRAPGMPMKDWKGAVRTWEENSYDQQERRPSW